MEEEDEFKETSNIMGQALSDRGSSVERDQAKVNKYKQPTNNVLPKPKEIVRSLAPVNKSPNPSTGSQGAAG